MQRKFPNYLSNDVKVASIKENSQNFDTQSVNFLFLAFLSWENVFNASLWTQLNYFYLIFDLSQPAWKWPGIMH